MHESLWKCSKHDNKQTMNTKSIKNGFTLIELLVAIAIIGVLSGVVLQSLNSARAKARNNTRLTQIDQINKALEISATGGNNKLPWPGSSTWFCLGQTTPCWGGVYTNNATVNNAIASGIAGGSVNSIPKDPSFASGVGDVYLYHPNITPTVSGSCTASTCPNGAYLTWVVEKSTGCGRGIYWIPNANGSGNSECLLRIGNAVTN